MGSAGVVVRDKQPEVTNAVYTSRVSLLTHISPSFLAHPMEGVREQLNRSVLRYVAQLGGVLLSYSGLRLVQQLGCISGDAPEIHLKVQFDATYFQPMIGDYLEGSVSRIGGDHIALLVLGVFNGSLAHPPGARRAAIQQDSKGVVFVVRSVTHANGLISMHGDYAEPGTYRQLAAKGLPVTSRIAGAPRGAVAAAATLDAEAPTSLAKKKKKRERE